MSLQQSMFAIAPQSETTSNRVTRKPVTRQVTENTRQMRKHLHDSPIFRRAVMDAVLFHESRGCEDDNSDILKHIQRSWPAADLALVSDVIREEALAVRSSHANLTEGLRYALQNSKNAEAETRKEFIEGRVA
jgi:hypothetical protein